MSKVKAFVQLTAPERAKIEVLLHQGLSYRRIGNLLDRSVSTISREVRRNQSVCGKRPIYYSARIAEWKVRQRHRFKPKKIVFDQNMKGKIIQWLTREKLSPELISARGRQQREDFVSYEWIYQWIWRMKFSQVGKDKVYRYLYRHLRHARRRRKRGNKHTMRGNIIGRRWIDQRPPIASRRQRQGDLEADIVLGKDRQPGLLVALDRRSRKTWLRKLKIKDTNYVMQKLAGICAEIGDVKTITLDNDQSFAEHYRLNLTGIQTFFTHPYSSQEKGSIENRIGIIRMFFPKKTDFKKVTGRQVMRVQNLINERPLRIFNYKSPNEIYIS